MVPNRAAEEAGSGRSQQLVRASRAAPNSLEREAGAEGSQSPEGLGAAAANGHGAGAWPRLPPAPSPGSPAMAGSGRLALRSLPGPAWVRGSGAAVLSRLRDAAVVRPGFLSAAEEETLSRELEPELRRRRYEYDHWDAVRTAARGAGQGRGALGWGWEGGGLGEGALRAGPGATPGWAGPRRAGRGLEARGHWRQGQHFGGGDEGRSITESRTWSRGVVGGQDQG